MNQFSLFGGNFASNSRLAISDDVSRLLSAKCVVALDVSGGKDSQACALALDRYLKEIGHSGERVLIHSDLGRTEWKDSLPSCRRLAAKLGWELIVERRKAGDMLARWQGSLEKKRGSIPRVALRPPHPSVVHRRHALLHE